MCVFYFTVVYRPRLNLFFHDRRLATVICSHCWYSFIKNWRSSSPGRKRTERWSKKGKLNHTDGALPWSYPVLQFICAAAVVNTFDINCSCTTGSLWNSTLASSCNTGIFFNLSKCILKRESVNPRLQYKCLGPPHTLQGCSCLISELIPLTLTQYSSQQATSRVEHAAFPDSPVSLPLLLPVHGAAGAPDRSEGPGNCQIWHILRQNTVESSLFIISCMIHFCFYTSGGALR